MNHPNNKLTPIQELTCKRQKIIKQCNQQEQLIGEHVNYINQNAGSLIIKGVKRIFFTPAQPDKSSATSNEDGGNDINNYIVLIKSYAPMLFAIVRPLLISWGVNKLRHNLKLLLSKKQK